MNIIPSHLIIISILVFGVLNVVENILHYNIGRNHNKTMMELNSPSVEDFLKIVFVMVIFAVAQGFLTELLSEYF